jgi:hypothetical protein
MVQFVKDGVSIYFAGERAIRLEASGAYPDETELRDLVRRRFGIAITLGPWKRVSNEWVAIIVTCIPAKNRKP